jgi:hypothetical protein
MGTRVAGATWPPAPRPAPCPEAEAASRAASAETKLATEEAADAQIETAVRAQRRVAARDDADPLRLRDANDPDCRDCAAG